MNVVIQTEAPPIRQDTSGADCLRLVQPDARCCVLRFLADVALERVAAGGLMAGVFVVPRRLAVRQVIEDALFIAAEATQEGWTGVVFYLPV